MHEEYSMITSRSNHRSGQPSQCLRLSVSHYWPSRALPPPRVIPAPVPVPRSFWRISDNHKTRSFDQRKITDDGLWWCHTYQEIFEFSRGSLEARRSIANHILALAHEIRLENGKNKGRLSTERRRRKARESRVRTAFLTSHDSPPLAVIDSDFLLFSTTSVR
jgi:hypothetical protein